MGSVIRKAHVPKVKAFISRAREIDRLSKLHEKEKEFLKKVYGDGMFTAGNVVLELSSQTVEVADSAALRESKLWAKFSKMVQKRVLKAYTAKEKK